MPFRPPISALALALLTLAGCPERVPVDSLACVAYNGASSVEIGGPEACPACGQACALPGGEVHGCLDGRCVVTGCAPGYHDLDGDPANGCECRGPRPDLCRPCGPDEILADGVDDDCDLRVDESVDPRDDVPYSGAGYDPVSGGRVYTRPGRSNRPNGERGALDFYGERRVDRAPPATRAACGADRQSCEAAPGAPDVTCVRRGGDPECRPAHFPDWPTDPPPVDDIVLPDRPPPPGGHYKVRDLCGDGLDQDRNGVVDDGLDCRTLVPAAAAPKCHGRAGTPGCPPVAVPAPGLPPPPLTPGEDGVGVAYRTRDVWLDLREANELQFARYLEDTRLCEAGGGFDHPLCGLLDDPDPTRPATGLSWCDAYDYCRWAGKRLPTEVEWASAYAGDAMFTRGNKPELCAGDAPPRHAACGAVGAGSIDARAGAVVRGTAARQTLSTHAFGNVAEWVFDADVDPCERPDVVCDGGEPLYTVAPPRDPVWLPATPDPDRPRLLRGGGWDSDPAALAPDARQTALPGTRGHHYGVRCAESFTPEAPGWAPYDDDADAQSHAHCAGGSRTARVAHRASGRVLWAATDACWSGMVADRVTDASFQAFARALTGPSRPLLIQLDALDLTPQLHIEVGLDAGSEAFWLPDARPTAIDAPGCMAGACSFEAASAALHPDPVFWPDLTLWLVAGHTLSASDAAATCLPASRTDAGWRLTLDFDAAAFGTLLHNEDDPAAAACAAAACVDPVDPAACATDCTRWRLTLDVAVDRLTPR